MTPKNSSRKAGFFSPTMMAWIGAGTVVLFELAVFSFRASEPARWQEVPRLNLSLPDHPITLKSNQAPLTDQQPIVYRFQEVPERLKDGAEQLAFAHGLCGSFIPSGQLTTASPLIDLFYFEYAPGNSRFIHDVYGHAPEVCMRSMGAVLERVHPDRTLVVEDSSIKVRVLEFTTPQTNSPLWVFKLTWVPEGTPYQPDGVETSLRKEKIKSGLLANPRPPARVVLVGARNFSDEPSAWGAFVTLVGNHLSFSLPST